MAYKGNQDTIMCAGVIDKIVVFLIATAGTGWAGGCTGGVAA